MAIRVHLVRKVTTQIRNMAASGTSASSVAAVVSRLSPIQLRTSAVPRFVAGAGLLAAGWADWSSNSGESTSLKEYLASRLGPHAPSQASQYQRKRPKVIIFGEQHHQPRVLAAQLQLIHELATGWHKLKVRIVMEHFNLNQQGLLSVFGRTGDSEPLQQEYAKSSEGFRIDDSGYLPLLRLARELPNVDSTIVAGFPPREWARLVMRGGPEAVKEDESARDALAGFEDRWSDLNVSPEHAAYIKSSISGEAPRVHQDIDQGGLKAAQAFKDAVMAWKIDEAVAKASDASTSEEESVIVAICGSGHCEYDFGVTERIRSCTREGILLLVSKPDDGGFWQKIAEGPTESEARALADGIYVYEAVDDF